MPGIFNRSKTILVPSCSDIINKLPIFNDFCVENVYFTALVDSGATVNIINSCVFNTLPLHIRRQKNPNNPNLTSVTGHKLNAKGSICLNLKRDNRTFMTNFIICDNLPYEAIIGANFLRSNRILLDVANEKLVYPAKVGEEISTLRNRNRGYEDNVTVNKISGGIMLQYFEPHVSQRHGIIGNLFNYPERYCRNEVNLNNKSIESAKIKIGDMRQYRSNEIKKIAEL